MRDGAPLPQRIQNAPQLAFGMQMYFSAFLDLTSCRQLGMSLGPIPWTAVNDYSISLGLDEEQDELLHLFVRDMDNVYVSHHNKKGAGK